MVSLLVTGPALVAVNPAVGVAAAEAPASGVAAAEATPGAGAKTGTADGKAGNSFQIGMHFGDEPFSGISIKRRVSSGIIMEGIANLKDYCATGSVRILFDLGKRGSVFRYMGVGLGGGVVDIGIAEPTTLAGVQGFIGIDYPTLGVFSFSTEIMMQIIHTRSKSQNQFLPKTGINWGWNYWF
ncbi:MAG TPA: hypothetical protein GXX29_15070 [Firmicutes bacterium]|nr:hypothetical protein [Bacillota bacterium]